MPTKTSSRERDKSKQPLKTSWRSHPFIRRAKQSIWLYILALFVLSRLLYVVIGSVSIELINRHTPPSTTTYTAQISHHSAIQMWYNWDASNYGSLARQYSASLKPLAPTGHKDGRTGYFLLRWLPLYPITVRLLSDITHISVPLSQLLVSNLAFIGALYLLYKLMRSDEDDAFARTVVAFMVILPASFVFSAALSEGLFLVLAIGSLYAARRQRWLLAGFLGMLLALTRSVGCLIAFALLVEALQQYGFDKKQWRRYFKPVLAAGLAAGGLLLFLIYSRIRTGNFLAYTASQYVYNGVKFGNPLLYVLHTWHKARTVIILAELAVVLLAWKKLRWSYLTYAIFLTLVTLSIGNPPAGVGSSLRYMAEVFPLAIAAGYLGRIKSLTNFLWTGFGIMNGMLFILWVNWWIAFII